MKLKKRRRREKVVSHSSWLLGAARLFLSTLSTTVSTHEWKCSEIPHCSYSPTDRSGISAAFTYHRENSADSVFSVKEMGLALWKYLFLRLFFKKQNVLCYYVFISVLTHYKLQKCVTYIVYKYVKKENTWETWMHQWKSVVSVFTALVWNWRRLLSSLFCLVYVKLLLGKMHKGIS